MAKIARNAARLYLLFAFTGRGKRCCICGRRSAHFAGFGTPVRPSARCPRCNSLERHRFLWEYLCSAHGLPSLPAGARLLHFAPEPFMSRLLVDVPGISYTTVDLDPGSAQVAADITALPFEDGVFDVFVCSHVLEHVPDDRKAMRELFRTMAHDGWGLVMVPLRDGGTVEDSTVVDPTERAQLFGQADHVRWYGDDLVQRLDEAGFDVEVIYPANILPEEGLAERGIPPDERMFRVRRRAAPATARGGYSGGASGEEPTR